MGAEGYSERFILQCLLPRNKGFLLRGIGDKVIQEKANKQIQIQQLGQGENRPNNHSCLSLSISGEYNFYVNSHD